MSYQVDDSGPVSADCSGAAISQIPQSSAQLATIHGAGPGKEAAAPSGGASSSAEAVLAFARATVPSNASPRANADLSRAVTPRLPSSSQCIPSRSPEEPGVASAPQRLAPAAAAAAPPRPSPGSAASARALLERVRAPVVASSTSPSRADSTESRKAGLARPISPIVATPQTVAAPATGSGGAGPSVADSASAEAVAAAASASRAAAATALRALEAARLAGSGSASDSGSVARGLGVEREAAEQDGGSAGGEASSRMEAAVLEADALLEALEAREGKLHRARMALEQATRAQADAEEAAKQSRRRLEYARAVGMPGLILAAERGSSSARAAAGQESSHGRAGGGGLNAAAALRRAKAGGAGGARQTGAVPAGGTSMGPVGPSAPGSRGRDPALAPAGGAVSRLDFVRRNRELVGWSLGHMTMTADEQRRVALLVGPEDEFLSGEDLGKEDEDDDGEDDDGEDDDEEDAEDDGEDDAEDDAEDDGEDEAKAAVFVPVGEGTAASGEEERKAADAMQRGAQPGDMAILGETRDVHGRVEETACEAGPSAMSCPAGHEDTAGWDAAESSRARQQRQRRLLRGASPGDAEMWSRRRREWERQHRQRLADLRVSKEERAAFAAEAAAEWFSPRGDEAERLRVAQARLQAMVDAGAASDAASGRANGRALRLVDPVFLTQLDDIEEAADEEDGGALSGRTEPTSGRQGGASRGSAMLLAGDPTTDPISGRRTGANAASLTALERAVNPSLRRLGRIDAALAMLSGRTPARAFRLERGWHGEAAPGSVAAPRSPGTDSAEGSGNHLRARPHSPLGLTRQREIARETQSRPRRTAAQAARAFSGTAAGGVSPAGQSASAGTAGARSVFSAGSIQSGVGAAGRAGRGRPDLPLPVVSEAGRAADLGLLGRERPLWVAATVTTARGNAQATSRMSVSRRVTRKDIAVETARARETFERVQAAVASGSVAATEASVLEPGSAEMAERIAELLRDAVSDPGLSGMEIVELDDELAPGGERDELSTSPSFAARTSGAWSLSGPALPLRERVDALLQSFVSQKDSAEEDGASPTQAEYIAVISSDDGAKTSSGSDISALGDLRSAPRQADIADEEPSTPPDSSSATELEAAVIRARLVLELSEEGESEEEGDAEPDDEDFVQGAADGDDVGRSRSEGRGDVAVAAAAGMACEASPVVDHDAVSPVTPEAEQATAATMVAAAPAVDEFAEADAAFMEDLLRRAALLGVRLHA